MFQLLEIRIVSRNWDRRMATAINQLRAAAEGTVDNELRGIARVIKSDDRPKKVVLLVCQVHKRFGTDEAQSTRLRGGISARIRAADLRQQKTDKMFYPR